MDEGKVGTVFVDSDVLVLAFSFERDKRHRLSEQLIKKFKGKLSITFWNYLEVLGVLSYNLPADKVEYFATKFKDVVSVRGRWPTEELVFKNILQKMKASDALTLTIVESEKCDIFITWNTKDFAGRTKISVMTPPEFMQRRV